MNGRKQQVKGQLRLQLIPDELKRRRLERAWTQTDLGERAGLDGSSISYMEEAKRNPKLGTIRRLAKALNCDVLDIAEVVQEAS